MNLLTKKTQDFRKSHNSVVRQKNWVFLQKFFGMMRTLVIIIVIGFILYIMYPTIAEWFSVLTDAIK